MASMYAPLPPDPWYPGSPRWRPAFLSVVQPPPLPWHVRHPTLAAGLIAATLLLCSLVLAYADDAAPLVAWLNELEGRAKRQWEADNAPKEEKK